MANIIKTAKAEHYNNLICDKKNDYREVYNIVNSLLFRKEQAPLPQAENDYVLAEQFSEYFKDKIDTIMLQLQSTEAGQVNPEYIELQHEIEHRMQSFMPISGNDITLVISSSPAKHCALDPLPTFMLKQNIGPFSEIIAKIVNTSLQQGVVSKNLKEALLKPLIKSMSLEVIFKSFRPISNLSFLSKMIERIVCRQLSNYMNRTGKLEDLQSAYRSNHLMETALLKVKTDILNAMQNKQVTCLILLDLLAAFDTISHSKLINRLKFRFGLNGVVLDWITDYLANRTQQVVIKQDKFSNSATSSPVTLVQGIPRGSVLGPNLFSWFISHWVICARNMELTIMDMQMIDNYISASNQRFQWIKLHA